MRRHPYTTLPMKSLSTSSASSSSSSSNNNSSRTTTRTIIIKGHSNHHHHNHNQQQQQTNEHRQQRWWWWWWFSSRRNTLVLSTLLVGCIIILFYYDVTTTSTVVRNLVLLSSSNNNSSSSSSTITTTTTTKTNIILMKLWRSLFQLRNSTTITITERISSSSSSSSSNNNNNNNTIFLVTINDTILNEMDDAKRRSMIYEQCHIYRAKYNNIFYNNNNSRTTTTSTRRNSYISSWNNNNPNNNNIDDPNYYNNEMEQYTTPVSSSSSSHQQLPVQYQLHEQQQQYQYQYPYRTELLNPHYFRNYTNLEDIFIGSGLDSILLQKGQEVSSTSSSSSLYFYYISHPICHIRNIKYIRHFPHAMQQLYRCWSWWEYNKKQYNNFIQSTNNNNNNNTKDEFRPILLWDNYTYYATSHYVNDFIRILQNEYNLLLIKDSTDPDQIQLLPSSNYKDKDNNIVQVQNTGKWEKDIELTDYAILPNDAQSLRKLIMDHIITTKQQQQQSSSSLSNFVPAGCPKVQKSVSILPKITIINRAGPKNPSSKSRSILNSVELLNALQQNLYPDSTTDDNNNNNNSTRILTNNNNVRIVYFENKKFIEQVQVFMESDIIITPHGAQLTSVLYQPGPCSSVLELFPRDYLVVDFFASLMKASSNINNHYFYYQHIALPSDYYYNNDDDNNGYTNTTTYRYESKQDYKYHYYKSTQYRDDPMCPSIPILVQSIQRLVQEWQICCHQQIRTKPSSSTTTTR